MHLRERAQSGFIPERLGDPDQVPLGENFLALGVGLRVVDPLAKFKLRSLIQSRYIVAR